MTKGSRTARAVRAFVALLLTMSLLVGCGGSSGGDAGENTTGRAGPQRGEESIEGFGEEAKGLERAALVASYRSFMGALAGQDYASVCAHLSASVEASLRRLSPAKGPGPCEAALPELLSPSAPDFAGQQARAHIIKVRVEGNDAFVIYRAPGAKLYQMGMARERGEWKPTTVIGSILVPSPATFGR